MNNQDTILDLVNDDSSSIAARIKIKLLLVCDPAQDVMRRIDAVIPRLDSNKIVSNVSQGIDAGASIAPSAYQAAEGFGTCIAPLGQALKLTATIMDKIADVRQCFSLLRVTLDISNSMNRHIPY